MLCTVTPALFISRRTYRKDKNSQSIPSSTKREAELSDWTIYDHVEKKQKQKNKPPPTPIPHFSVAQPCYAARF